VHAKRLSFDRVRNAFVIHVLYIPAAQTTHLPAGLRAKARFGVHPSRESVGAVAFAAPPT